MDTDMDVKELAEELYDLIVVKGRWGGRRSTVLSNDGSNRGDR